MKKSNINIPLIFSIALLLWSCDFMSVKGREQVGEASIGTDSQLTAKSNTSFRQIDADSFPSAKNIKTIHIKVALCDNKYQGIVKVPAAIGNGLDPSKNLYWGAGYGISTFFKSHSNWTEVKRYKINDTCLQRIIFKHKLQPYYLIADAYNGKYIEQCTKDFLNSVAGKVKDTIVVDKKVIGIEGNAKLLAYIGHNGLMDFSLNDADYICTDNKKRDAIILACASKQHFTPFLKNAQAKPLLWTTNLMCPEAYTLAAALDQYIAGKDTLAIWHSGASAYSKYQKCSVSAAKKLIVTGW